MSFGSHSFGSTSFGSARTGHTVLPAIPESGRGIFLEVDLADDGGAGATWTKLAQQLNATLSRGVQLVDVTYGADEWQNSVPQNNIWAVSVSGRLDLTDSVMDFLRTKHEDESSMWLRINGAGAGHRSYKGQAWLTDLGESYPLNGSADYELEFQGEEALTEV